MTIAEAPSPGKLERIRTLNDNFRRSFVGGVVVVTQGIQGLNDALRTDVLAYVRSFNSFTEENDPNGEHDLGTFDIHGTLFMWKMDYYHKSMEYGSPDAADLSITTRVLTVMLANEY